MKHVYSIRYILLTIFISALGFVAKADPQSEPLYLSYEQRFAVSLAVEIATTTDPQNRAALMREVARAVQAYSGKTETVEVVSSYEDFIAKWRGPWTESASLSFDVEQALKSHLPRRRVFHAKDAALQSRIDTYRNQQISRLMALAKNAGIDTPFILKASNALLTATGMNQLLQEGEKLLETQMERVNAMSEDLADKAFSGGQDKMMKIAMKTVFKSYYSKLGLNSKKAILSGFLGSNLSADKLDHFTTLLQGSGPQLQKMIQTVARDDEIDPQIAEVFQRLEDRVKPVPFVLVKQILESERLNYDIVSFEEKPLGVGTMAQVHRAVIIWKDKKKSVAIRFIKPGISERVEEDDQIFREIARELDSNTEFRASGGPRVTPLVDEISNTVRAEESIPETRKRQNAAQKPYTKSFRSQLPGESTVIVNFKVPRIYEPRTAVSAFHVQELVPGKKFESVATEYRGAYPRLRESVAVALAKLWLNEVLFDSGFYHSDLHQGNYLAEMKESEIDISLLDYGMAGGLTKDLQNNIIALSAALEIGEIEVAAQSFWKISNQKKNETKFEVFQDAFIQEMKEIRQGRAPVRDLKKWTVFAIDHGLALPYDFVNINRGLVTIERVIRKSGSRKTLISIVAELATFHPARITKILLDAGIPISSIAKLGWDQGLKRIGIGIRSISPESTAIRCEAIF